MNAPIPAPPKANLLAPVKAKQQKPKFVPPEHLTRSIGSEFPALRALGTKKSGKR